jgi:hypothetical protein
VELAAALFVTLLLVAVFVSHRQVQREGREGRADMAELVRHEAQRLEREVSRANALAKHAVASAERAEDAASRAVRVVSPGEKGPKST